MGERTRRVVVAWGLAAALAGCGGAKSSGAAVPSSSTIGPAGGSLTEGSGATVTIPPGAIAADTTIAIARDPAGAPALPTGLVAAGSTYVITPHGSAFIGPVEVRIPSAGVVLQPNQELRLAEAEPGGDWGLVDGSALEGGMLRATVRAFSYFVPVVVNYPQVLVEVPPFRVTSSRVDCGASACSSLVDPVTATFTVTTNEGQLPSYCSGGSLRVVDGFYPNYSYPNGTGLPLAGGSVTRTVTGSAGSTYFFGPVLRCDIHNSRLFSDGSLYWPTPPPAEGPPFRVTSHGVDCGAQDCYALVGPATVTFSVTTNEGLLPAGCSDGSLRVFDGFNPDYSGSAGSGLPASGGLVTRAVSTGSADHADYSFGVALRCNGVNRRLYTDSRVYWASVPTYPGLRVWPMPTQFQVMEGTSGSVEATLSGGASRFLGSLGVQGYARPSTFDRAVVDWERSDDEGTSWSPLAQSYEDQANPSPYGADALPGRYWSVRPDFLATAADHGALVRVRACYTPFDAPAEPCVVSPPSRLSVIAISAGTTAPSIVEGPRSVLVTAGQVASFSVAVGGTPAPTLQWQTRVANSTGPWTDVSSGTGATGLAFTTEPLALASNGRQYRVVATNGLGDAASLPVTASVSDADVAPTITTQPASLTVTEGSDATFAVDARGTEALGYQWRRDGTPVAGANGPVLRLPGVEVTSAGAYSVVVSNAAGSATSAEATLTVGTGSTVGLPPAITIQPAPATALAGTTASFSVTASGSPLAYQWERNGVPIPGADGATYTTPDLTVGDDGATFAVLVYNGAGLVFSQAALLTVRGLTPPGMALFVGDFALGFGGGGADGTGIDARLDDPDGLVADAAGNLYVAEANNPAVAKVSPAGVVTTLLHHPNAINSLALGPDGSLYVGAACGMPRLLPPLVAGGVNQPVQVGACPGQVRGVTVDGTGAVLVSLPGLNSIRGLSIVGGVVSFPVFAGALNEFISPGTSDGNGTSARFRGQQGMVRASDGTLYVADTENHTIRKVSPAGDVTTWIGAAGLPGLIDGRGAAARLYRPTQLSLDTSGNLYVLTQGDPAAPVAHVHRVSPAGDVVTVFNATDEILALATPAQAGSARVIKGLAVLGGDRVALTAGNAIVLRTL